MAYRVADLALVALPSMALVEELDSAVAMEVAMLLDLESKR